MNESVKTMFKRWEKEERKLIVNNNIIEAWFYTRIGSERGNSETPKYEM